MGFGSFGSWTPDRLLKWSPEMVVHRLRSKRTRECRPACKLADRARPSLGQVPGTGDRTMVTLRERTLHALQSSGRPCRYPTPWSVPPCVGIAAPTKADGASQAVRQHLPSWLTFSISKNGATAVSVVANFQNQPTRALSCGGAGGTHGLVLVLESAIVLVNFSSAVRHARFKAPTSFSPHALIEKVVCSCGFGIVRRSTRHIRYWPDAEGFRVLSFDC